MRYLFAFLLISATCHAQVIPLWKTSGATKITPIPLKIITTDQQFESTLTTGTAPFLITSTTKVANLNVDQVDGYSFDQDLMTTGSPTFKDLAATDNTTLGNSAGDAVTFNADVWTVPHAVTWTKTAETGVAEELARWKVSDSTNYVRLVNGTSNASQFAPTFEAFIEPTIASTALTFSGTKGVSTTPGNPAILYIARYNSGSGNTDIPDAGIMTEWRNRATSLMYVYGNGDLVLVKSGAKLGYGTGTGGTVTQATDKTTGVTLSKSTGQITLNAAALASDTTVSFTLTNTAISATDVLILNHVSGGTPGSYTLNARCGSGSAVIDVRNVSGGSLSEAIVIQYVLVKGAAS